MAEDSRKLFVAGLPDTMSEDILRQLFEATGGSVVEISLPRDRATGRPRGFGFVTLSSPAEAESARESLDGSFQGGKEISVRPFQAEPPRRGEGGGGGHRERGGGGGPPQQAPDSTLYVGNLPYDATPDEVETYIKEAGGDGVTRIHLPSDAEGRRRGFGFVSFASGEKAKESLDLIRGQEFRGRRLVVNIAHPKGERPPREDRPPRGDGGGYGGGGGGYGGGGGGYGGGGPPSSRDAMMGGGGGPPPPRKTFDDRRRNKREHGGGRDREGFPAGGGRRRKNNHQNVEDFDDYKDWED